MNLLSLFSLCVVSLVVGVWLRVLYCSSDGSRALAISLLFPSFLM